MISKSEINQWVINVDSIRGKLDLATLIWFWMRVEENDDWFLIAENIEKVCSEDIDNSFGFVDLYSPTFVGTDGCPDRRQWFLDYRDYVKKLNVFSDHLPTSEYIENDDNIYDEFRDAEHYYGSLENHEHPVLSNKCLTYRFINLDVLITKFKAAGLYFPKYLEKAKFSYQSSDVSRKSLTADAALKNLDQHHEYFKFYRSRLLRAEYVRFIDLSFTDIKKYSDKFKRISSEYNQGLKSKVKSVAYLAIYFSSKGMSLSQCEEFLVEVYKDVWISDETEKIYLMHMSDKVSTKKGFIKVKSKVDYFKVKYDMNAGQARALIKLVTPDVPLNSGSKGGDDVIIENISQNRKLVDEFFKEFYNITSFLVK